MALLWRFLRDEFPKGEVVTDTEEDLGDVQGVPLGVGHFFFFWAVLDGCWREKTERRAMGVKAVKCNERVMNEREKEKEWKRKWMNV